MAGFQATLAAADALVLAAMRAQYDNQAAFHAGAQQATTFSTAAALGPGVAGVAAAGLLGQALPTAPAVPSGHHIGPAAELYRDLQRVRPGSDLDKGESSSIKKSAAVTAAAMMARPFEKPQPQQKPMERMHKLREEKARREAEEKAETERRRCPLHSKPKKGCKRCQKYQEFLDTAKEEKAAEREKFLSNIKKKDGPTDEDILDPAKDKDRPLELVNTKTYGFTPLLQSHIVESAHFKTLMNMESFEQIYEELYQYSDTVEPYAQHSSTSPSAILCCVYRLFTIGLESRFLRQMMESAESPFTRCAGFLFVRFGLSADQFWPWLGEYILDDEEFQPDADHKSTIGEYVEDLLCQEKYYNTILPRLPATVKRKLEEKLAQVPQYRKRTQANRELLHVFRQRGLRVEACPRDDGEWLGGEVLALDEATPSRYKVRLRFDNGEEANIHLGKVILNDRSLPSSTGSRRRHRSRSRSPGGNIDWSRDKGRSINELIEDLRNRDRERAVVTSGKEYSRRPVSFQVALPMDQGNASYTLAREETLVKSSSKRSSGRSRSRSQERRKEPSAEHQERMRQLFLKYGSQSKQEQTGHKDIETPDVMRLG